MCDGETQNELYEMYEDGEDGLWDVNKPGAGRRRTSSIL